jgi:hypothetical protein
MVFQLAEAPGKGHVLGTRQVLVAQEQHLVAQQRRPDLRKKRVIAHRVGQPHAGQFGADGACHGLYAHACLLSLS